MKKDIKKSVMPATVAPVQRETAATISRDGGAISPLAERATKPHLDIPDEIANKLYGTTPFAGDDAE